MALLDRLWVLDDARSASWPDDSTSLRAHIERHVFRNPGDWTAEDLFEQLGAFEAGDARFGQFLEGLVSADVIPDEPAQRRVVDIVNPRLRAAGAELRETGTDGGYPVFSVVSTRAARTRRPKNLIFASLAKPDIRFANAIDNDIEIVENADKVLVYDRPIGGDGLRWRDLQAWWKDTQQIADDDEAKRSLYQRLASSLPGNSPPQRNLFDLYHEIHGSAVPDLPALLPEVWLHWDPKTARERGRDALLRFRMDFLLLLPHGQRVVLEVDGSHHFTSPDGTAGRRQVRRRRARRPGPQAQRVRGIPLRRHRTPRSRMRPHPAPAVLRRPVPAVRRNPRCRLSYCGSRKMIAARIRSRAVSRKADQAVREVRPGLDHMVCRSGQGS